MFFRRPERASRTAHRGSRIRSPDVPETRIPVAEAADAPVLVPRRWTLHGLNNGAIFTATRKGVGTLPRAVAYGVGRVGTWIAWRTMARSRAAVADNLSALFPGEDREALERRALGTFRSYARDTIDFLKALDGSSADRARLFDIAEPQRGFFDELRARGKGIILVTGHFGNWEVGGVLFGLLGMPFTIVAMAEPDPTVNRIRREIRERIGADTIEVRQSLDTALQIRRCLAENRVVAMLVDRHYGRDRVRVTFFGRPAWFLRTPFVMGHVTGAPVLPCSVERLSAGRFAIRPGTPVYVTGGTRDEAIARAAQHVADTLEERIRQHPEYWYQFYRYWDAQRDDYDGLA
jgi:KDO2-lipid IV(A) lauroyltransferase